MIVRSRDTSAQLSILLLSILHVSLPALRKWHNKRESKVVLICCATVAILIYYEVGNTVGCQGRVVAYSALGERILAVAWQAQQTASPRSKGISAPPWMTKWLKSPNLNAD